MVHATVLCPHICPLCPLLTVIVHTRGPATDVAHLLLQGGAWYGLSSPSLPSPRW